MYSINRYTNLELYYEVMVLYILKNSILGHGLFAYLNLYQISDKMVYDMTIFGKKNFHIVDLHIKISL